MYRWQPRSSRGKLPAPRRGEAALSMRFVGYGCALAAALLLAGCERSPPSPPPAPLPARDVSQPEGWADELAMPTTPDLAADPRTLEVELTARIAELTIVPGTKTAAWTYNGALPGPLLRAKVGDRLIVHFKNELPEATTIHWHGLRVPNDMD